MFVKPRAGLIVRNPDKPFAPLPVEGKEVPRTSYWLRRLRDKDIELADSGSEEKE